MAPTYMKYKPAGFCFFMLVICYMILIAVLLKSYQGFDNDTLAMVALTSLPLVLFTHLFFLTIMKWELYTGRNGEEILKEDGSPFVGNLLKKNGRLKPINLIVSVVFIVIAYVIMIAYAYRLTGLSFGNIFSQKMELMGGDLLQFIIKALILILTPTWVVSSGISLMAAGKIWQFPVFLCRFFRQYIVPYRD